MASCCTTYAPAAPEAGRIVALVGNPNSGKTTLFNALTGLRHKVANYPGVTVEEKSGEVDLPGGASIELYDLPGLYSLSGSSLDEAVATQVIVGGSSYQKKPDLVVAVADATNLERHLFLISQLLDLHLPLIVVLTMVDMAAQRGIRIAKELLSRRLGIPVLGVIAGRPGDVAALKHVIEESLRLKHVSQNRLAWLKPESGLWEKSLAFGRLISTNGAPDIEAAGEGLMWLAGHTAPPQEVSRQLEEAKAVLTQRYGDVHALEAKERYDWIRKIVAGAVSTDGRGAAGPTLLERASSHRVLGLLGFLLVMAVLFQSVFWGASYPMAWIDSGVTALGSWTASWFAPGRVQSFFTDGLIASLGSILVFLPQIAILFFLLTVLEDSGYLARAAVVTDRVLRPFGLQGRSFIPLLSCFACAVPGIMSARTIPDSRDRLRTILVAPLISCSARLPVYSLLIAAFIPQRAVWGFLSLQGLALMAMYLLGGGGAMGVAWLLQRSVVSGKTSWFALELPPFRNPSLRNAATSALERVFVFLRTTGVVVLFCGIILWGLASFPGKDVGKSFAARIGHAIEPAIRPLGFNWEIGVGLLGSFAAREVFISTLATVYNLSDEDQTSKSLVSVLKERRDTGNFPLPTALSLMVFFVFACQCISTLATCRRETGSWGWTAFVFAYTLMLAYLASLVTYHLASGF